MSSHKIEHFIDHEWKPRHVQQTDFNQWTSIINEWPYKVKHCMTFQIKLCIWKLRQCTATAFITLIRKEKYRYRNTAKQIFSRAYQWVFFLATIHFIHHMPYTRLPLEFWRQSFCSRLSMFMILVLRCQPNNYFCPQNWSSWNQGFQTTKVNPSVYNCNFLSFHRSTLHRSTFLHQKAWGI